MTVDVEIEIPDAEFDRFNDLKEADAAAHSQGADVYDLRPSDFTEFSFYLPSKGVYKRFSFEGRGYLRQVYDTPAKRRLLMAGRQVEKCCVISSTYISSADGKPVHLSEIFEGLQVVSAETDARTTCSPISWISEPLRKPCVRITTRQGHSVEVATTHPMRLWGKWVEASELSVGDRLAVLRRGGRFTATCSYREERIKLTAYLIGDGGLTHRVRFTAVPGPVLDDFTSCLDLVGNTYKLQQTKSKARDVCLHVGVVRGWMSEDQLLGKGSASKFVPGWVFRLSREQTALFINRLWSTDGHVKKNSKSKYSIKYCSISKQLIRQVQSLLWKFGIPSRIRENVPTRYKGTEKKAYILRVETQEGVCKFLSEIGALGKSESIPLPDLGSNNNRDTYPPEIEQDIQRICRSNPGYTGKKNSPLSLHRAGLRHKLKYPLTREKLEQYIQFFRSDDGFDQQLVDRLAAHLDTDLYWDEIVDIEDLGEQECVDFQVEEHHNFVANGFITHNSTLLGNQMLSYVCMTPGFNALYVSPSHTQTKTFSRDRISEPIETSPFLKTFTNSTLTANLLEKKFINRSQITLRFAFLNADRVRGIPADYILIDEIQDILIDNIPVIEECASHSEYQLFTYAGTPKSLDNAIEHYWQKFSTQNEWVVPCERHGTPNDPGSWHWNVLDEKNIGAEGLICDKCGHGIKADHPHAQWASLNPDPGVSHPYEGFRIPQLMVPWIDWGNLLDKYEKYSRAKFYNEVLGRSFDSGTRPLTQTDIKNCCLVDLGLGAYRQVAKKYSASNPLFMGIDWGCHDDQTRILTKNGWKYFSELDEGEEVAQFDQDTREMSFVVPQVRTVRDWDEPLYHYKSKQMDMMLTGTHRMLVRSYSSSKDLNWKVEPCSTTAERGSKVKFRGWVTWQGEEQETFTLPGLPSSPGYPGCEPRVVQMDDWLEFLGLYLSEGGLCFDGDRPSCIKMSQRQSVNPEVADQMLDVLDRLGLRYSTFPNKETSDLNITIYGKQVWHWILHNVGERGHLKRIPRRFLELSARQLGILFWAMMAGDGTIDPREGCDSGSYCSTSKGLCEDVQELAIRMGLRALVSPHKPAQGNKKAQWRTMLSGGRDHVFNPKTLERHKYQGKVYCCKVPKGFIVTERNGRVAYQGNTGEADSYTVITIGGYLPFAPDRYTIFYAKRCTGQDSEPKRQIELVKGLAELFSVAYIGADYGGGHWPNDDLLRHFGAGKLYKYQWVGTQKTKVKFDAQLGTPRYLVHRTEIMSDMFNAIKRGNVFAFPRWEDWNDPFAMDMLNIFSEYNDKLKMNQYKRGPGMPDDTFHSMCFGFLASFHHKKRPDVIVPQKTMDQEHRKITHEELDIEED